MAYTQHGRSHSTWAGVATRQRLPRQVRLVLVVVLVFTSGLPSALALDATPTSEDDTQLYVGHGTQLTARIPSAWTPDLSLTYDYRFRSGFIASIPIGRVPRIDSLEHVCAALATHERYGENGQVDTTTWRGRSACIVRTHAGTAHDPVSLVMAHPDPAPDGRNAFVAVTVDGTHFDDITATISFDPSIVTPTAYVDAALDIFETRSLWRDRIDWPEVRAAAHAYLDNDHATSDSPWLTGVYDAITYVLGQIQQAGGDAHHAFLPPPTDPSMGTPSPPRPYFAPTGRQLANGVGYVALPGVSTGDQTERYVTETRSILAGAQTETSCGWIVDLREDTGGNMYAMIGGLAPLLPPDVLMSFRNAAGDDTEVVLTDDGIIEYDGTPIAWLDALSGAGESALLEQPVAMLIGPSTASAGEGTAVAFAHRDDTRFFGEESAGLATAPTAFYLFDDAMIGLATVWMSGPHGAIYPDGIMPDVDVSPSDVVAPPAEDPVVQAATEWLTDQPGCKPAIATKAG